MTLFFPLLKPEVTTKKDQLVGEALNCLRNSIQCTTACKREDISLNVVALLQVLMEHSGVHLFGGEEVEVPEYLTSDPAHC
jgi:hypothetical protein